MLNAVGVPVMLHVPAAMERPAGKSGDEPHVAPVTREVEDVVQSASYHARVSSSTDAETMSRSPSPSMSPTKTSRAPVAEVVMSVPDQDGSAAPLFWYHAMVWSKADAETMSRSPSPSKSAG